MNGGAESDSDVGGDDVADTSLDVDLPQTNRPAITLPSPSPCSSEKSAGSTNLNRHRNKRKTKADDLKQLMAAFASSEESAQKRFIEVRYANILNLFLITVVTSACKTGVVAH